MARERKAQCSKTYRRSTPTHTKKAGTVTQSEISRSLIYARRANRPRNVKKENEGRSIFAYKTLYAYCYLKRYPPGINKKKGQILSLGSA